LIQGIGLEAEDDQVSLRKTIITLISNPRMSIIMKQNARKMMIKINGKKMEEKEMHIYENILKNKYNWCA